MFRVYKPSKQKSLIDSEMWMNRRTIKRLEESWAPIFKEYIFEKIDEEPFRVLYSNNRGGAPNFPVRILLSLELIKHMFDISDEDILQRYDFDFLVNYALGFHALGMMPMAERTLYHFRERLYLYMAEHPEMEDLIFGQFKQLTAVMSGKAELDMREQRIDTTMFMSNIKKGGRISLAYDVLARGAKVVPENERSEQIEEFLSPKFKQSVIYKAKSSETESKLTILLRHCQTMLEILENGYSDIAQVEIRILKRLIAEQGETTEAGTLTAKDGKKVSPKSLQSAHDEDATYRKKNEVGYTGYTVAITETCSEDNPFQLITDYSVEQNVVSDTEILDDRLEHISETGCDTLYSDGGFCSGAGVEKAEGEGITMRFSNTCDKATDNIKVEDFDISSNNIEQLKCPMGVAPDAIHEYEKSVRFSFGANRCRECPSLEICLGEFKLNRFDISFSRSQIALIEYRRDTQANIEEIVSRRAAIEGTNSALKRQGLGKLKVRGKIKSAAVCGLKIMAQNIKRFVRYCQGFYENNDQGSFAPVAQ